MTNSLAEKHSIVIIEYTACIGWILQYAIYKWLVPFKLFEIPQIQLKVSLIFGTQ